MMSSLQPRPSTAAPRRKPALATLAPVLLCALATATACGTREGADAGADTSAGVVVIVNAPSAGEVRRVLVKEGAQLRKGDAVAEIVVRAEGAAPAPTRGEDPVAAAGRNIASAQAEIDAARAEVVRAEVDVQRLTPLVASGQASQGELDGARSNYERAQQRLQRAQTAAQGAQSGLVAARQPQRTLTPPPAPSEQVVYATASSDGTVSAVSVRAGARVTAGQPLATLRAGQ
jgi:multidrug resistance efflux pump